MPYSKGMAWEITRPWWQTGRPYGVPEGLWLAESRPPGTVVPEVLCVKRGGVDYGWSAVHELGLIEWRSRQLGAYMVSAFNEATPDVYEPEPWPHEAEAREWAAKEPTETLFAYRDAGLYAELLMRLHPADTRPAWMRILRADLANAAAHRHRSRSHDAPRISFEGDTPDARRRPDPHRERLVSRRAYNPLLDTMEGQAALVEMCAQKGRMLDPAALADCEALAHYRQAARNELIERHTPLIFMVALKARNTGRSAWDTRIAAGYEGLIRSVDTYDDQANTFSTYASQVIGYYMLQAARVERGQQLHMSKHMLWRIGVMRKVEDALTRELQRQPRISEIAKRMGVKPRTVAIYKAREATGTPLSLDATMQRDHGKMDDLYEVVPQRTYIDPEEAVIINETLQEAFAAAGVGRDELRVACGLFGIVPYREPMSAAELATELHIAQAKVDELFASVRRKLLHSPQAATILHAHIKETIAP